MVYDGDCGFCRLWIKRWRFLTGEKVDYRPYQETAARYPEISMDQFQSLGPVDRARWKGFLGRPGGFPGPVLSAGLGWLPGPMMQFPGLAFVSEKAYGFVAAHRGWFSRAGSCGLAPADETAQLPVSRWLFVKMLALAFLVPSFPSVPRWTA